MEAQPLYDLAPAARVALTGIVLAGGPLAWIWLRHRGTTPAVRLRALTLLALFLSFDLVVFGAFTRLTDSGLGCPDWPGCYGNASPLGAQHEIQAAQTNLPSGPVTHGKAWIEMIHRYLATGVGVLISVLALASWIEHRRIRRRGGPGDVSPWWATATLLWIGVQGAFGALTVTMKLYPAIVTAHLLGGVGLLALLAAQAQGYVRNPVPLSRRLFAATLVVLALCWLQTALGGWVSTNYAVLACTDFPACQGSWWPEMDFGQGFAPMRELGQTGDGAWLPFAALTAIHYVHRLGAYLVLGAVALLAWRLAVAGRTQPTLVRWAWALGGIALWQLGSGLSNVFLGWPLVAAVAHTGGAAALVTGLTVLITRARQTELAAPWPGDSGAVLTSQRTAS
jgi:cytochrome c oxidase assembly protein subunit 15